MLPIKNNTTSDFNTKGSIGGYLRFQYISDFTILILARHVYTAVMDRQKCRSVGAAFVLLQGAVTALFPQLSVKLTKRMIGKNFDNASRLEATPTYLRQLRAIGVGMIAAAGTDLLLQSLAGTDTRASGTDPSDERIDADGSEEPNS